MKPLVSIFICLAAAALAQESPRPVDDIIPPAWGVKVDPLGVSQWRGDNDRMMVTITPLRGVIADYNPQGNFNAPRLSREVTGDFTAEVTVAPLVPGVDTEGKAGGGFISGGLLIAGAPGEAVRFDFGFWNDKPDERVQLNWHLFNTTGEVAPIRVSAIALDRTKPIHFRVQRRGALLYGWVGNDRTQLSPIYPHRIAGWPATIQVGALALSTTPVPVSCEFSAFTVTQDAPANAALPERSAAAPAPRPLGGPEVPEWGRYFDPSGVASWSLQGPRLALELTGVGVDLSFNRLRNAPRVLREVEGDFTATVLVHPTMNPMNPAAVGVGGLFQTAGLTVTIDGWQYVRFERNVQEDWGRKHTLYFEHGENGSRRAIRLKKATWNPKEPLWLRLVRRAKTLSVSAKTMEGDWQPVGDVDLPNWPSTICVGVHATNTTVNPFTALLEDFTVTFP